MFALRLPEAPPADHMEAAPQPPPLKCCVWGKVGFSFLACPPFYAGEWGGSDH